jgi:hypothetical protein
VLEFLLYAGGIVLGLASGVLFVVLWRLCMAPGSTRRMIRELADIAGAMTHTDEIGLFLALYKRLFLSVGDYLVRNVGGLILACLPIALVLMLLMPPVLEAWGESAGKAAVYPATIPVTQKSEGGVVTGSGPAIVVGGTVVPTIDPSKRYAACWDWIDCLIFRSLGFDVTEVPDPGLPDESFVVVRPDIGTGNPAWPILSTPEFVFFVAFMVGTFGMFLLPRRRR